MLDKTLKTPSGEKINRVPVANSLEKQLIKITGTLTSQIQLRGEGNQEPYYYAFVRLKGQNIDLPVIFKVQKRSCQYCEAVWEKQSKCGRSDCGYYNENCGYLPTSKLVKPHLKKSDSVELFGHYSNSPQSIRKSFTCLDYQTKGQNSVKNHA